MSAIPSTPKAARQAGLIDVKQAKALGINERTLRKYSRVPHPALDNKKLRRVRCTSKDQSGGAPMVFYFMEEVEKLIGESVHAGVYIDDLGRRWLSESEAVNAHGVSKEQLQDWHNQGCPYNDGKKLPAIMLRVMEQFKGRLRPMRRRFYLEVEILAIKAWSGRLGPDWLTYKEAETLSGYTAAYLRVHQKAVDALACWRG